MGVYLALGGGRFEPPAVADACELRPSFAVDSFDAAGQELALGVLAGAACQLGVTREELALALVSDEYRERLIRSHDLDDGIVATLLRAAAEALDLPDGAAGTPP